MKYNRSILVFELIVLLTLMQSCGKKLGQTFSVAKIYNETNVVIDIVLYDSGKVIIGFPINIQPKNFRQVSIESYVGKGIQKESGFNNEYFSRADSMVVVFNDSFKVTHYRDAPSTVSTKHYLSSDSRCIMNVGNWKLSHESSKHSITNYYSYIFTEADYEYAKQ